MVLAFTLGNDGWRACGAGAQVVFGGREPVDDGGAPCDCESVSTYSCWDVDSRIGQGMDGRNVLSIVHMVKQSQPFSCPFRAKRTARLAMVGKMMAEAPSPDRPMKNSHAMTGSRRPGTLRKGRASAMQYIACWKPRILTRRAPRMTKTKVRAKLMMMS